MNANTENERKNAGNGAGAVAWLLYFLISAGGEAILIYQKAAGRVSWGWSAVLLSYFWISFATMAAFILLAVGAHIFCRAMKQHRERERRRRIARSLWDSMEGLTLNSIGPIYGVRRQQGEKNRSYKRRILKAARTLDTVNLQAARKPAISQSLDSIAGKYGIQRRSWENDEDLRERIKKAAINRHKWKGAKK